MITFYTKEDQISFGKYLLSKERHDRIERTAKEINGFADHNEIYAADFCNWAYSEKTMDILLSVSKNPTPSSETGVRYT